jgi:hypothetical protein
MSPDLDDEYHEYLWGEASPRAFARKARNGPNTNNRISRVIELSKAVPR